MDCPHRRWGGEEYRARHLPIEVRARGVGGANVTHSKCPPRYPQRYPLCASGGRSEPKAPHPTLPTIVGNVADIAKISLKRTSTTMRQGTPKDTQSYPTQTKIHQNPPPGRFEEGF